MKRLLLVLSLAAPLCADSKLASKIANTNDADVALKIWHSDAKAPEQQVVFFQKFLENYPWDSLTVEQQRKLVPYWQSMKPEAQVQVSAWVSSDVIARLEKGVEKQLPHAHRPHHQHHHHTAATAAAAGGEKDVKHTHGAPKSKPQPKKSTASAASAASAASEPLMARVDPQYFVVSNDGDATTEFQMSLKSPKQITGKVGYPNTIRLIDTFPAIGIYGDPYIFRTRLALIELGNTALKQLPDIYSLVKAAPRIDCHVVISGLLQGEKTDRVNNLVFHAWTAKLEGKDNFTAQVPMGIFKANGVQAAPSESIGFNALAPLPVNPHPPMELSPNNARFEINNGHRVATFWSIAQYKDAATVTFHVILNDPKLVDILRACISEAVTGLDLAECIGQVATGLVKGPDRTALEKAQETIAQLLFS